MHYFADYLLFFSKTLTFVLAFLACLIVAASICTRNKETDGKIIIKSLNDKYKDLKNALRSVIDTKQNFKAFMKQQKKSAKVQEKNQQNTAVKRMFVLDFVGDLRAQATDALREEINAILCVATPADEVVIRLESGGGVVYAYGLCSSQLARLREKNIPLTVTIDRVAASGGYMMASVANKIIAAPFSIVGSIGVVAQLPNFHRYLKQHNIDFELVTAGEYKRTLTLFGENTEKGRHKVQEEVDEGHLLFKSFIAQYRPQLPLDLVATGEYWMGTKALELKLIDQLGTSDDYLFNAANEFDIYSLKYLAKKGLASKFSASAQAAFTKVLSLFQPETNKPPLL